MKHREQNATLWLREYIQLRYDLERITDKALDPAKAALNQLIEDTIKEIKPNA